MSLLCLNLNGFSVVLKEKNFTSFKLSLNLPFSHPGFLLSGSFKFLSFHVPPVLEFIMLMISCNVLENLFLIPKTRTDSLLYVFNTCCIFLITIRIGNCIFSWVIIWVTFFTTIKLQAQWGEPLCSLFILLFPVPSKLWTNNKELFLKLMNLTYIHAHHWNLCSIFLFGLMKNVSFGAWTSVTFFFFLNISFLNFTPIYCYHFTWSFFKKLSDSQWNGESQKMLRLLAKINHLSL